jgi:hypothetical protein
MRNVLLTQFEVGFPLYHITSMLPVDGLNASEVKGG